MALAGAGAVLAVVMDQPVQDPTDHIHDGMTEDEVRAVLGDAREGAMLLAGRSKAQEWEVPGGTVWVTFDGDGKAVRKGFTPREPLARRLWRWVRAKTGL